MERKIIKRLIDNYRWRPIKMTPKGTDHKTFIETTDEALKRTPRKNVQLNTRLLSLTDMEKSSKPDHEEHGPKQLRAGGQVGG
jgi:hypothetical protein